MLLTISKAHLPTCVQLLSAADVLFTPHHRRRGDVPSVASAVAERRAAYRRQGLPWLVGGDGAARVAGHRKVQALVDAGLLKSRGVGRDRAVKLTKGAEWYVRAVVASYLPQESAPWQLLTLVASFADAGNTNAGHALEIDLLGIEYGDPQVQARLADLEEAALPLLVAGWLDSASDMQGSVGYTVTHAGRKALAGGRPNVPDLPDVQEVAGDQYAALRQAGLAERETWQPSSRSLVSIPLSAGRWPEVGREGATSLTVPVAASPGEATGGPNAE